MGWEVVEQIDDLPGRAGFAQPREDAGDAVGVRVGIHIGHGVDGEGDVEPEFVARGGRSIRRRCWWRRPR